MIGWLFAALTAAYMAQLVAVLLLERERPAYMGAWLFIAILFPYIGFAAYAVAGMGAKRRQSRQLLDDSHAREREAREIGALPTAVSVREGEAHTAAQERLFCLLGQLTRFPATGGNATKVLTNGQDTFAAMLAAIAAAHHYIYLDYYTIRSDSVGQRFLEALEQKALRGVEVKIIYDGIGSLGLEQSFLERLKLAGAQAVCFSPPRSAILKRTVNFRNHRKVAVVDGKIGFLGGINIGDEYIGLDKRLGFWRDTHLQIEGPTVRQLQRLFMDNWQLATGQAIQYDVGNDENDCTGEDGRADERVMIVPGRPGTNDRQMVEVLCSAMSAARRTILATTPYFIPDSALAASLRAAARSGIDVKLIIPGISDSKLVLLATLSHVQDMLEAGVSVYRYQKGFIHAKVLIVDTTLASVGTANLDMRSFYSNYELLALLFDPKPINKLLLDFKRDLADSLPIDPAAFRNRSRRQRAGEAIMHLLGPLL